MKLRIGVGLGPRDPADPVTFGDPVVRMEQLGVDSPWLPDALGADLPDPLVGSGVTVLPGRNPVVVAKELATLAALAPGRILPVFDVRHATARERPLFPIPGPRGEVTDEAPTVVRLLLEGEDISFEGKYHTLDHVTIGPRPVRPLDLWLGGGGPR
ncbi:LLM class flavin-dependent oxidoreductase [Embleya hyalina]|uniref:LLM class F420-dependent oxidoreductase n=1 Tax=Embleya hyalina TaxID=516124 RepID=A0A401YU15_9ACTN|nr:LLM class flavin-dependent oxidoreductase [Embleya hyalina]GCD98100.1 LLM class F420-dependent oxidoreductase [Embleya hyalina]